MFHVERLARFLRLDMPRQISHFLLLPKYLLPPTGSASEAIGCCQRFTSWMPVNDMSFSALLFRTRHRLFYLLDEACPSFCNRQH